MCLSVWDTTRSPDQWKVFILRTCGIYNLAYWEGGGFWENNQTGDARGTFYRGKHGTGIYTTTDKPYSNGLRLGSDHRAPNRRRVTVRGPRRSA
ncbi:hypothetical protein [Embleya sp. NPDC005575]|uniref:hypothetical protein n=1 Tax=Embleya sp. NPDC005575 TaxID=3156892 RepID=UPI00339E76F7